jgi:hypothetical protein
MVINHTKSSALKRSCDRQQGPSRKLLGHTALDTTHPKQRVNKHTNNTTRIQESSTKAEQLNTPHLDILLAH